MNIKYVILSLLTTVLYGDFDYKVENTNITLSQNSSVQNENKTYVHNYNRLRFLGDYTNENYFSTIIADSVNYMGHNYIKSDTFKFFKQIHSDTSFKTQTNFKDYGDGAIYAKLYRLYGGYEDNNNKLVLGLQNISMGVGRIWSPTNLFNHNNVYAIEPDEVFGVNAISYTRYLDDTSHARAVISQKRNHSLKYAFSYKTAFDFAEIGINFIKSNETKMIGYEIEANLGNTGIEVRSEGAYINNNKDFFQSMVGGDYGFENGVIVAVEVLYSSKGFSYQDITSNANSEILANLVSSKLYTGLSASYNFNIFLDASLLYIESFDSKNSRFISPSITYILNDINSFVLGSMIYDGDSSSEFGSLDNIYYFKWALSF